MLQLGPLQTILSCFLLCSLVQSEVWQSYDSQAQTWGNVDHWRQSYQANSNKKQSTQTVTQPFNKLNRSPYQYVEFNSTNSKKITLIGCGNEIFDIIRKLKSKSQRKDVKATFVLNKNNQYTTIECIDTDFQLLKSLLKYYHLCVEFNEEYYDEFNNIIPWCHENLVMLPSKEESETIINQINNLNENMEEYPNFGNNNEGKLFYNNYPHYHEIHLPPEKNIIVAPIDIKLKTEKEGYIFSKDDIITGLPRSNVDSIVSEFGTQDRTIPNNIPYYNGYQLGSNYVNSYNTHIFRSFRKEPNLNINQYNFAPAYAPKIQCYTHNSKPIHYHSHDIVVPALNNYNSNMITKAEAAHNFFNADGNFASSEPSSNVYNANHLFYTPVSRSCKKELNLNLGNNQYYFAQTNAPKLHFIHNSKPIHYHSNGIVIPVLNNYNPNMISKAEETHNFFNVDGNFASSEPRNNVFFNNANNLFYTPVSRSFRREANINLDNNQYYIAPAHNPKVKYYTHHSKPINYHSHNIVIPALNNFYSNMISKAKATYNFLNADSNFASIEPPNSVNNNANKLLNIQSCDNRGTNFGNAVEIPSVYRAESKPYIINKNYYTSPFKTIATYVPVIHDQLLINNNDIYKQNSNIGFANTTTFYSIPDSCRYKNFVIIDSDNNNTTNFKSARTNYINNQHGYKNGYNNINIYTVYPLGTKGTDKNDVLKYWRNSEDTNNQIKNLNYFAPCAKYSAYNTETSKKLPKLYESLNLNIVPVKLNHYPKTYPPSYAFGIPSYCNFLTPSYSDLTPTPAQVTLSDFNPTKYTEPTETSNYYQTTPTYNLQKPAEFKIKPMQTNLSPSNSDLTPTLAQVTRTCTYLNPIKTKYINPFETSNYYQTTPFYNVPKPKEAKNVPMHQFLMASYNNFAPTPTQVTPSYLYPSKYINPAKIYNYYQTSPIYNVQKIKKPKTKPMQQILTPIYSNFKPSLAQFTPSYLYPTKYIDPFKIPDYYHTTPNYGVQKSTEPKNKPMQPYVTPSYSDFTPSVAQFTPSYLYPISNIEPTKTYNYYQTIPTCDVQTSSKPKIKPMHLFLTPSHNNLVPTPTQVTPSYLYSTKYIDPTKTHYYYHATPTDYVQKTIIPKIKTIQHFLTPTYNASVDQLTPSYLYPITNIEPTKIFNYYQTTPTYNLQKSKAKNKPMHQFFTPSYSNFAPSPTNVTPSYLYPTKYIDPSKIPNYYQTPPKYNVQKSTKPKIKVMRPFLTTIYRDFAPSLAQTTPSYLYPTKYIDPFKLPYYYHTTPNYNLQKSTEPKNKPMQPYVTPSYSDFTPSVAQFTQYLYPISNIERTKTSNYYQTTPTCAVQTSTKPKIKPMQFLTPSSNNIAPPLIQNTPSYLYSTQFIDPSKIRNYYHTTPTYYVQKSTKPKIEPTQPFLTNHSDFAPSLAQFSPSLYTDPTITSNYYQTSPTYNVPTSTKLKIEPIQPCLRPSYSDLTPTLAQVTGINLNPTNTKYINPFETSNYYETTPFYNIHPAKYKDPPQIPYYHQTTQISYVQKSTKAKIKPMQHILPPSYSYFARSLAQFTPSYLHYPTKYIDPTKTFNCYQTSPTYNVPRNVNELKNKLRNTFLTKSYSDFAPSLTQVTPTYLYPTKYTDPTEISNYYQTSPTYNVPKPTELKNEPRNTFLTKSYSDFAPSPTHVTPTYLCPTKYTDPTKISNYYQITPAYKVQQITKPKIESMQYFLTPSSSYSAATLAQVTPSYLYPTKYTDPTKTSSYYPTFMVQKATQPKNEPMQHSLVTSYSDLAPTPAQVTPSYLCPTKYTDQTESNYYQTTPTYDILKSTEPKNEPMHKFLTPSYSNFATPPTRVTPSYLYFNKYIDQSKSTKPKIKPMQYFLTPTYSDFAPSLAQFNFYQTSPTYNIQNPTEFKYKPKNIFLPPSQATTSKKYTDPTETSNYYQTTPIYEKEPKIEPMQHYSTTYLTPTPSYLNPTKYLNPTETSYYYQTSPTYNTKKSTEPKNNSLKTSYSVLAPNPAQVTSSYFYPNKYTDPTKSNYYKSTPTYNVQKLTKPKIEAVQHFLRPSYRYSTPTLAQVTPSYLNPFKFLDTKTSKYYQTTPIYNIQKSSKTKYYLPAQVLYKSIPKSKNYIGKNMYLARLLDTTEGKRYNTNIDITIPTLNGLYDYPTSFKTRSSDTIPVQSFPPSNHFKERNSYYPQASNLWGPICNAYTIPGKITSNTGKVEVTHQPIFKKPFNYATNGQFHYVVEERRSLNNVIKAYKYYIPKKTYVQTPYQNSDFVGLKSPETASIYNTQGNIDQYFPQNNINKNGLFEDYTVHLKKEPKNKAIGIPYFVNNYMSYTPFYKYKNVPLKSSYGPGTSPFLSKNTTPKFENSLNYNLPKSFNLNGASISNPIDVVSPGQYNYFYENWPYTLRDSYFSKYRKKYDKGFLNSEFYTSYVPFQRNKHFLNNEENKLYDNNKQLLEPFLINSKESNGFSSKYNDRLEANQNLMETKVPTKYKYNTIYSSSTAEAYQCSSAISYPISINNKSPIVNFNDRSVNWKRYSGNTVTPLAHFNTYKSSVETSYKQQDKYYSTKPKDNSLENRVSYITSTAAPREMSQFKPVVSFLNPMNNELADMKTNALTYNPCVGLMPYTSQASNFKNYKNINNKVFSNSNGFMAMKPTKARFRSRKVSYEPFDFNYEPIKQNIAKTTEPSTQSYTASYGFSPNYEPQINSISQPNNYGMQGITYNYPFLENTYKNRPTFALRSYDKFVNANTFSVTNYPTFYNLYRNHKPFGSSPVRIDSFPSAKLFYTTINNNKASQPKSNYDIAYSQKYIPSSNFYSTFTDIAKTSQLSVATNPGQVDYLHPTVYSADIEPINPKNIPCTSKLTINEVNSPLYTSNLGRLVTEDIKRKFLSENVINKLYNLCFPMTIDLGTIGIAKYMPDSCEKQFTVQTNNPNIELRAWQSKLKVIKPRIDFDVADVGVLNFVPIIKCHYNNDYDNIQEIVKNIISNKYGEPIVIRDFIKCDPFAVFCDVNSINMANNNYNILWPTYDGNYCRNAHSNFVFS